MRAKLDAQDWADTLLVPKPTALRVLGVVAAEPYPFSDPPLAILTAWTMARLQPLLCPPQD